MLSIAKMIKNPGPDSYYSPEWRNLIENHLDYLRNHPETIKVDLDGNVSYENRGDFIGILLHAGAEPQYHWAIMRVNKLQTPADYTEDMLQILLPSKNELSRLNRFVATA